MVYIEYTHFIPLFTATAFVITTFWPQKLKESSWIPAVVLSGMSMVLSLLVISEFYSKPEVYEVRAIWFSVGAINFECGIYLDGVSIIMLLIVSFIGFLIVVYSHGYMHGDPGLVRYYAEISLFITAMLGLVLANNYLQMFIFWELVGLCSYLLIGFWFRKPEAARAAKKAFLVTRIGDMMFIFGIFMLVNQFQTLNYRELTSLLNPAKPLSALVLNAPSLLPITNFLLFGGAIGKSAQFPLHVWLPDAMEGPTTVSALIHAATMVKAGVYLVARLLTTNLLVHTPDVLLIIAFIGGFTAFFSATMAMTAYDIKRVLAYSTISQLGYMILALGTGAVAVGMFHLANHAFVKALLFLCAGSVIHACGTNDIREHGGLHSKMKITSYTMLIASLSISGIGLSALISKDEIFSVLLKSSEYNQLYFYLYILALLTAFMTAFYMFRMWFMTFTGKYRGKNRKHLHESPPSMTVPLIILAVPAAAISYLAIMFGGSAENPTGLWKLFEFEHPYEWNFSMLGISLLIGLAGMGLAYFIYVKEKYISVNALKNNFIKDLHTLLSRRYYIDDIYDAFCYYGVYGFSKICDWFDRNVIDGTVNGIAKGSFFSGNLIRKIQTGVVNNYAMLIAVGVASVLVIFEFLIPYFKSLGVI